MKRELKNEVIPTPVDDPGKALRDYGSLFSMNQKEIEEVANDESEPIVKRKMIEFLVSEDPKVSMEAIKWIQNVVSGNNIVAEVEIGTSTTYLSESQHQIYKEVKESLKNQNRLKKGDDHLLKLYAINLDRFNKMSMFIEVYGSKAKFGSGHEQIRPEVTMMNNYIAQVVKLSNMLGLNTMAAHKNGINDVPVLQSDPLSSISE